MKRFIDYISETCNIGRKAKGMSLSDLAKKHKVTVEYLQKQLDLGIKAEKEHTKSDTIARKIAMDHLFELPDYYSKLEKMEEDAPTNNVGGGHIAGVSPGEVPPVRLKKKKRQKKENSEIPLVNVRWTTPFPYKPFSQ